MTLSEAFLRLAKGVAKHFTHTRQDAERIWLANPVFRRKAELTPEHKQELITILGTKFPRPTKEKPNGQHE